jgi:hypothetical protein
MNRFYFWLLVTLFRVTVLFICLLLKLLLFWILFLIRELLFVVFFTRLVSGWLRYYIGFFWLIEICYYLKANNIAFLEKVLTTCNKHGWLSLCIVVLDDLACRTLNRLFSHSVKWLDWQWGVTTDYTWMCDLAFTCMWDFLRLNC